MARSGPTTSTPISTSSARTVEAVQAAQAAAQPVDLLLNRAYVDENMNRRFFLSDETYLGVPGNKHLSPITTEHADKELGILAFCPQGTRYPSGVIVNYGVHPLVAGHLARSSAPTYPASCARSCTSLRCPICYTTGAAGDNHPKSPEAGYAEMQRAGRSPRHRSRQASLRRPQGQRTAAHPLPVAHHPLRQRTYENSPRYTAPTRRPSATTSAVWNSPAR